MWEVLKEKVEQYRKADKANTQAYFIIEALKTAGHATALGGREAEKYLHELGMNDETIFKMKKKYKKDPATVRESLVSSLLNN